MKIHTGEILNTGAGKRKSKVEQWQINLKAFPTYRSGKNKGKVRLISYNFLGSDAIYVCALLP